VSALLEIASLGVTYRTGGADVHAVTDVSLTMARGERVGVIGESGSGKSVMARSILRLDDPRRTRFAPGARITLAGHDVLAMPERAVHALRGETAGIIFQNPMHALNPAFTVGAQMHAVLRAHRDTGRQARRAVIESALAAVDLPRPGEMLGRYPHELSGGQRQRVLVAQSVLCEPRLVIADEPTSALDVTAQDRVLDVLGRLSAERGIAVLLITHDLGVVARFCRRVNVMYGGRLVESGTVETIFARPSHPYTAALLGATPNPRRRRKELTPIEGTQPARRGALPAGCVFAPRCPHATDICRAETPPLRVIDRGQLVACHHAEELIRAHA